jgi:hypothetical protein
MASIKRVLSPTEWKDRQIANLKASGRASYLVGLKSPKADPIQRGIDTEEKYANNTKKAIESGARKLALGKTNMAEWYKYSAELGADKLVDGVVKREAKVTAFTTSYQPMLVDHLSKIDALAEDTDTDRENKMLENLRGLKALKGKA